MEIKGVAEICLWTNVFTTIRKREDDRVSPDNGPLSMTLNKLYLIREQPLNSEGV
jgi:hypothetical protein